MLPSWQSKDAAFAAWKERHAQHCYAFHLEVTKQLSLTHTRIPLHTRRSWPHHLFLSQHVRDRARACLRLSESMESMQAGGCARDRACCFLHADPSYAESVAYG